MPFRADTLAFGAFVKISESEAPEWIQLKRRIAQFISIASGALLVALSALPKFRTGANSVLFNSVAYSLSVFFFGGTLVCVLGLSHGPIFAILTCRPMRYLGQISYTFYLYHVAVLSKVGEHTRSTAVAAALSFAVTAVIAALSWKFLESPILNAHRQASAPLVERC
jgi:peptidoglycan/LPS O-acetylase OafA/YrhL